MTHVDPKKNGQLVPLVSWLIYSLGTLIVFEFGPMDFPLESRWRLYLYLFFVHVAVILGYYYGVRKYSFMRHSTFSLELINKKNIDWLALLVLVGIVLGFAADFSRGASIGLALEDALAADENYSGGGFLGYVRSMFSVLTLPFLAISIVSIKKTSNLSKVVFFLLVIRILYASFVGSSRHGVFMLLIVSFFSILALIYSRQTKIKIKTFVIGAVVCATLFLAYSSYLQVARQLDTVASNYVSMIENNPNYEYDHDSALVPHLPATMDLYKSGILTGYFYFSHAYVGLGNALNLPFKGTTLFFGHSDFTIRNLARILGDEVYQFSYPHRLIAEELGYKHHWYTAYAWLASDTTFVGSIAVVFFFGSMFAKSWVRVLTRPDLRSCAVLGWMGYFFFQVNMTFVPADLGAFVSFWGSLALFTFRWGGRKGQYRTVGSDKQ